MRDSKHTGIKPIGILLLLIAALSFQFCDTTKKITASAEEEMKPVVSYNEHILPLMTRSCTPCHFPERGQKMLLDTYASTRNNIVDIMRRVQLATDHADYMPFKSKKEALTTVEINAFKEWIAQEYPK
jgi:protein-arginine kinase activator protein McsA